MTENYDSSTEKRTISLNQNIWLSITADDEAPCEQGLLSSALHVFRDANTKPHAAQEYSVQCSWAIKRKS